MRRIATAVVVLLLLSLLLASLASARPYRRHARKAYSLVGIGTYAAVVDNPSPFADDKLYGFSLTGTLGLGPSLAVRGNLYFTEHDDVSGLDNNGLDAQLLFGGGMNRYGFKYYGIVGLFSETWDSGAAEHDFSGLELGFGIGYDWRRISLDWWGVWRDPGDYEDLVRSATGVAVDLNAASGALMLTFRP